MDLPIPDDARTAQSHAAPIDLTNPPSEPSPSTPQEPQHDTAEDRGAEEYTSPEPIEVIFAQMRDDLRRNERLLMLTATTVVFMGLLFAYYVRKGGLDAFATE